MPPWRPACRCCWCAATRGADTAIASLKTLDSNGEGPADNLLQAAMWLLSDSLDGLTPNEGNATNAEVLGVDVVNLSLGAPGSPFDVFGSRLCAAFKALADAGIVSVAAAGAPLVLCLLLLASGCMHVRWGAAVCCCWRAWFLCTQRWSGCALPCLQAMCASLHERPHLMCAPLLPCAYLCLCAVTGNEGAPANNALPAACPGILSVTALNQSDGAIDATQQPPYWSNYLLLQGASTPPAENKANFTICAPGWEVYNTCWQLANPLGYCPISGTSQATPHVSGMLARCFSGGRCKKGGSGAQSAVYALEKWTAYNLANPEYGDAADPIRSPKSNKYYGYLTCAGVW